MVVARVMMSRRESTLNIREIFESSMGLSKISFLTARWPFAISSLLSPMAKTVPLYASLTVLSGPYSKTFWKPRAS